jgi:acyl-CoA thioesterase FadM
MLLREEQVLNQATVEVVCVNDATFKPTALPTHIRQKFEGVLS